MAAGRIPTTANSPITAKGDLFTFSTAPARLAVGNDGEQIVADSAATTGLRYQSNFAAGKNAVINSNFEIWQRGTSVVAANGSGAYTADRWSAYNASYTVSQQSTSDTTNLPFINKCARVQRNLSATATNGVSFVQPLESVNSKPFIGKVATLSFYARAGANYSSASSALLVYLLGGTGTDQNPNNTYTGQTTPISQTATLTTTWQRFSYTTSSTLATTINELATQFTSIGVGTAGANDYFEVTGVQLEISSVATAYSTNSGTFQGELAACQRYYVRFIGTGNAYTQFGLGWAYSTTQADFPILLPVQMRTSPTAVEYHSSISINYYAIANFALTTLTLTTAETSPNIVNIISAGSTGLTQYRIAPLMINGNTAGYLAFTAEL